MKNIPRNAGEFIGIIPRIDILQEIICFLLKEIDYKCPSCRRRLTGLVDIKGIEIELIEKPIIPIQTHGSQTVRIVK